MKLKIPTDGGKRLIRSARHEFANLDKTSRNMAHETKDFGSRHLI